MLFRSSGFTTESRLLLPYKGSWGGMEVESPHTLLACRYSSHNDVPALSHARFALNHDITASSGVHVADADNSDWKNTDDALYLGSLSNTEATLRCAQDSKNIYFLMEVSEAHLSSGDYVKVIMSQTDQSGAVCDGAIRIKIRPFGTVTTEKYSDSRWQYSGMGLTIASAYDGTVDEHGDTDNGYIVEVAVSRTLFNATDGHMLVNFALSSNDADGARIGEDSISTNDKSTSRWIKVSGL